ncbi:MAG: hypothetical protein V3R93_04510 [Candidatus Hydrothermarchaeaceae archaeon]
MKFTAEERGQVEAIDTLIFAALVSISAVLIATYGVGSYHQDLHMQALQHRYTADFSQSFVMTSQYVSAGEGDIAYTIGPQIKDESIFYSLSGIINRSIGSSPLDRNVKGSVLDVIAEDLYLSLEFHSGNDSYPLNNWFLTSGFHEKVNDFVIENLDFLSGGMFYYRLETSYYPYESTDLEDAFYSEAVYTNARGVPNASVYVTEIIIAIPAVSEDIKGISILSDFSNKLNSGLIKGLLPDQMNVSGRRVNVVGIVGGLDGVLTNISESTHEVKRAGKVTIKIWPRVGGESAGRVL